MKIQDIQIGDLYSLAYFGDLKLIWALVTNIQVWNNLVAIDGYVFHSQREELVLSGPIDADISNSDQWFRCVYRNGEKLT